MLDNISGAVKNDVCSDFGVCNNPSPQFIEGGFDGTLISVAGV